MSYFVQNDGGLLGWLVFCSQLCSHSDSRPVLLTGFVTQKLPREMISVVESASAGFEQAGGELRPELSKVQVKNQILPGTESEVGQKSEGAAIAAYCCRGWALLVFSEPPVCHVPPPLEAVLRGRNAAEQLSAGVCLLQGSSMGWYHRS